MYTIGDIMELLKLGSAGPNVELIQSTLQKLGYYRGIIDGVFDLQTQNAVKAFQRAFGIPIDGIVGDSTWNRLFPYLNGYTLYSVQPGDTIYSLANYYNTDIYRIIMANPKIENPNSISPGQLLVIPFGNVVDTNISYTYSIMMADIIALNIIYPFLEVTNIGNSVLRRPLPVIRLGRGPKEVFYNASFHANEWITSVVLMKFVEDYALAYTLDYDIYGYRVRDLFENVSIYIMPMVNPDGVDLATGYFRPGNEIYESARRISSRYPDIPFPSGWKANIRGVDLNLQFPARWEEAKKIKFEQGFTTPAPRDYVGTGPLTEPESLAVYNFTLSHNFRLVIAYHTQGEVIYWKFLNYLPPASRYIAEQFSTSSGYSLEETPFESSFAGYKDWFIQDYNRPGYTIEAGLGENPLPISDFNNIYNRNIGILILGAVLA